jgi:hypothetical protein
MDPIQTDLKKEAAINLPATTFRYTSKEKKQTPLKLRMRITLKPMRQPE